MSDNKCFREAVLMYFSQAFNTLKHGFLIVRLENVVLTKLSTADLQLRQKKINKNWCKEYLRGFSLFIFNFHNYLNDFLDLAETKEICSSTKDMVFHSCDEDLNTLISRLEHDNQQATNSFENKDTWLKGHVWNIFAILFFVSKRKHFWNCFETRKMFISLEKLLLLLRYSNFGIVEFYISWRH